MTYYSDIDKRLFVKHVGQHIIRELQRRKVKHSKY